MLIIAKQTFSALSFRFLIIKRSFVHENETSLSRKRNFPVEESKICVQQFDDAIKIKINTVGYDCEIFNFL